MARRKKLNKALAISCAIIFSIFGVLLGFFGQIFLFGEAGYSYPETHNSTASISVGNINVETIKNEDLSIHFLELGNKYTGDCTFIKVGENEILIDAGSRTSSIEPIHDYITDYITDGELEYVIVTHAHRDHYAGFATEDSLFDALNESNITIGNVIIFSKTNQDESKGLYKSFNEELEELQHENSTVIENVLAYCNESGTLKTIDLSGDGNIELEFLYQKFYEEEAETENNYSVCCILNQENGTNDRHYLFTGDLEYTGEESLIENNPDLPKVELYKAGHHGSKTSSSETLLNVIQPKHVCVCACAGSPEYTKKTQNQFPTQEFIDRIALYTDSVYVTTLCVDYEKGEFQSFNGNIIVSASYGEATAISCAGSKLKLKESEWFKANRTCPPKWVS